MFKNYKFYKETDGRWYIDLPEWEGTKDELEMVAGADTMLDYMTQGDNEIYLSFSDEKFDGYEYELILKEEIYDGGTYDLINKNIEFEVWLCEVTKFVFGYLPKNIYIK